jgi:hypothetical protein
MVEAEQRLMIGGALDLGVGICMVISCEDTYAGATARGGVGCCLGVMGESTIAMEGELVGGSWMIQTGQGRGPAGMRSGMPSCLGLEKAVCPGLKLSTVDMPWMSFWKDGDSLSGCWGRTKVAEVEGSFAFAAR